MKQPLPIKTLVCCLLLGLIPLALDGCAEIVESVPTVAALPTLTPSPMVSSTPAIAAMGTQASAGEGVAVPTIPVTPTITLTPAVSPTAILGATVEASEQAPAVPAPAIVYFVASPEETTPGEPVLLLWASERGTEAAIYRLNPDGSPGQTWTVDINGSLVVTPEAIARSEVYVLAISNGLTTIEEQVTIATTCPNVWFFTPEPQEGCPLTPPQTSAAATQEFQGGRMFWFEATGEVIVLFDDLPIGAPASTPAWLMPQIPEGSAEPPAVQPPDGFYLPQGGFGNVWRYTEGVSDRLGWATTEESTFVVTYQVSLQDDDRTQLYFTNPQGEVITLVPGGEGWLVAGFAP